MCTFVYTGHVNNNKLSFFFFFFVSWVVETSVKSLQDSCGSWLHGSIFTLKMLSRISFLSSTSSRLWNSPELLTVQIELSGALMIECNTIQWMPALFNSRQFNPGQFDLREFSECAPGSGVIKKVAANMEPGVMARASSSTAPSVNAADCLLCSILKTPSCVCHPVREWWLNRQFGQLGECSQGTRHFRPCLDN